MHTHSHTNAAKRAKRPASALPEALQEFDRLPDAAHVRAPVVAGLLSCSLPTVWRRVKSGAIPRPRKLGANTTAWNVGELRRALAKPEAAV